MIKDSHSYTLPFNGYYFTTYDGGHWKQWPEELAHLPEVDSWKRPEKLAAMLGTKPFSLAFFKRGLLLWRWDRLNGTTVDKMVNALKLVDPSKHTASPDYPAANDPILNPIGWLEARSGNYIYVTMPNITIIDIEDIAHSLANTCRYMGHCEPFYSVAEHSILVYTLVASQTSDINTLKWALLHDATEAYMHDCNPVLKQLKGMEQYRELEGKWTVRIAQNFNIPLPKIDMKLIKDADRHALRQEAKVLMRSGGDGWDLPETRPFPVLYPAYTWTVRTIPAVREAFLKIWNILNPGGR